MQFTEALADDNIQVDSEYEQPYVETSTHDMKRKSSEDMDTKLGPQVNKFRGTLSRLDEMPLDVLFEILGNMKPLDLLQLARTTKDLRAILMNRSSTSIWRHARSQHDNLPDCPDDLSEPQYAKLLFETACTFCQEDHLTNEIIWTIRVRTCSTCLYEQFYFLPISNTAYPKILSEYIKTTSNREKRIYPRQLHGRLESEYLALQIGRIDWVDQKVKERKAINAHAKLCEKWLAVEMTQRRAIIMERMKTLGWADELERMSSLDHDLENYIEETCEKNPADRALLHIDDPLNTFMGVIKAKRLRRERDNLLQERLPILRKTYDACVSTYPVNSIIPCSADVLLDPFVWDLILSPPSTATLTDKDLVPVKTAFPDIVLRWREKTEEKLLNMFAQACGTRHTSESMLQLATTVFSCESCPYEPLTYPRVLIHHCATQPSYDHADMVDEDKSLSTLLGRRLYCTHWNLDDSITFDAKTKVCLTEVIKLCGLDPTSCTRDEMDQLNPIFECISCNDVRKGRRTLSWLGVIPHTRLHPLVEWTNEPNIKLLNDEDATMVRDRMAEASSRSKVNTNCSGFCCVHCKLHGDVVTLAKHVKEVHPSPDPTSEDIVPLLDYTHLQTEYRLWPPNPVADIPNLIPLLLRTVDYQQ